MKTIGLLGGMSWQSTALYYRLLNEKISNRCGDLHSAKLILVSVDFQEVAQLLAQNAWPELAVMLSAEARNVEQAGADFLVICTNTIHKLAQEIGGAISIPLLHIGEITATAVNKAGLSRVGLLGTRFTMEESFYRDWFAARGITTLIPAARDRQRIDDIIFGELCRGVVSAESRREYLRIIASLQQQGAEGIVLGCTEITLLVHANDTALPLFDTTELHAEAAANLALMTEG